MAVEDPNKVIRLKDTQAGAQQGLSAGSIRGALQAKQGHPKLESALQQLYTAATEQGAIAAQGLSQRQGIADVGGQIQVIVEMEPQPADLVLLQADNGTSRRSETEGLRRRRGLLKQQIEAAGITPEAEYQHLVQVRVSPDHLVQLADMPGVRFVRLPHQLVPLTVTSEGVALTGAANNYHANGFTGTGVTVAVFDLGFIGLQNAINNGELPSTVIKRDCTFGSTCPAVSVAAMETESDHGTAVTEIVHDMAPGANLWLFKVANEVGINDAKNIAIANSASIISMSVGVPGDGFVENAGVTDDIVNDARAQGVLWVNAAGNSAANSPSYRDSHWRGSFIDTNANGFHEFLSGADEGNDFSGVAGQSGSVTLIWNNWPTSNQDYNLHVCSQSLWNSFHTFVDACLNSTTPQTGSQPPIERVSATLPLTDTYFIVIEKFSATGNATFELYMSGAPPLQYAVAERSLLPPADAIGAIAIGAVDKNTWTSGPQEIFSSQGPTNDGRTKPDIMGPDQTASFTYGVGGFLGTSASAPHVAGALALLKQANPSMTPTQLENLLYANAIDMGAAGHDNIFGRGRMRLPAPSTLGVSLTPSTWAIGAIPLGTTVRMNETNDVTVNNTGNVAETLMLRIKNPGTAWAPGLGAGTESFHLQGLFVGSTDAPGPSNFQADDTLFSGAPVGATATQFGMASGALGFNPDAGGALTSGLTAYWKLDEASGSRFDAVGTNHLTDHNTVTSAVGKKGNAAQFTAVNSEYLSISDNASLSTGDINFAFAGWVYLDNTSSTFTILQKGQWADPPFQKEYRLEFDGARFAWHVGNGVGTTVASVQATSFGVPSAGAWYFLYAYHDATTNQIGISVNNGTVNTASTSGPAGEDAGIFIIGALDNQGAPFLFMNGRIDEVGFWKRVLTPQERTDLYQGGLGNTVGAGGTSGVGVPPGGARDLWFSFTAPTSTSQTTQQSIVVEIGAEQPL